jgi:ribosomal-protein-alanine N-acetyltransferase
MPAEPRAEAGPVPRELRTERLRLRSWRESDLAPFAALNADPEVMRYFPSRLSREESDAMVARVQARIEADGHGFWAVEAPGVADFVGFVGISRVAYEIPRITPCVEIGWRLARPFWGRGYATEAARAAIEFGFGALALDEIVAFTATGNLPSQAVMARLGMTRDVQGDFEHPRVPEGHPIRPHVIYRLRRP